MQFLSPSFQPYEGLFLVKKKDAPVEIVGDDAVLHIVQNALEIAAVQKNIVDARGLHFSSDFCWRKGNAGFAKREPARVRMPCERRAYDSING